MAVSRGAWEELTSAVHKVAEKSKAAGESIASSLRGGKSAEQYGKELGEKAGRKETIDKALKEAGAD